MNRKRPGITSLLVLIALAGTARAQTAIPQLGLRDGGDRVTIEAAGLDLAPDARIEANGDRLDIELAGNPTRTSIQIDDQTVKEIEIRGRGTARLSIQLRHGRRTTAKMARAAAIVPGNGRLAVILPRDADNPIELEPEMTVEPLVEETAVEEPIAASGSVSGSSSQVAAGSLSAPMSESESGTGTGTGSGSGLEQVAAATSPESPAGSKRSTTPPLGSLWMALAGVLGLAGIAGLYLKRRRKSGHTPSGSIELVATQSLGPKAKVVWLTTGERELIVAVGETGPRLLSSWRKRAPVRAVGTQPLPRGGAEPASFEHSVLPRARTINTSPAVAGLVKLREQSPAPINEEVATDDPEADAEWARELLKATRQDLRAS